MLCFFQINETNDLYDNKVQVIQEEGLQQFVFTYRCANVKGNVSLVVCVQYLIHLCTHTHEYRSVHWY